MKKLENYAELAVKVGINIQDKHWSLMHQQIISVCSYRCKKAYEEAQKMSMWNGMMGQNTIIKLFSSERSFYRVSGMENQRSYEEIY
ncbi:hypothetical protein KHA80_00715 [Anaerobacillus sp. HL2]|nr:hypothetical protein KHA80_00715 [Anaerobacillus sp. HL2]